MKHELVHERSGMNHWRKRIVSKLGILLADIEGDAIFPEFIESKENGAQAYIFMPPMEPILPIMSGVISIPIMPSCM